MCGIFLAKKTIVLNMNLSLNGFEFRKSSISGGIFF